MVNLNDTVKLSALENNLFGARFSAISHISPVRVKIPKVLPFSITNKVV